VSDENTPAPAPAPGKAKAATATAPPELLTVVQFSHVDPIFDVVREGIGVVVGADDQGVDVVPLAGHRLRVSADDVDQLTAADLESYGD
jgi:hypothetical protein